MKKKVEKNQNQKKIKRMKQQWRNHRIKRKINKIKK